MGAWWGMPAAGGLCDSSRSLLPVPFPLRSQTAPQGGASRQVSAVVGGKPVKPVKGSGPEDVDPDAIPLPKDADYDGLDEAVGAGRPASVPCALAPFHLRGHAPRWPGGRPTTGRTHGFNPRIHARMPLLTPSSPLSLSHLPEHTRAQPDGQAADPSDEDEDVDGTGEGRRRTITGKAARMKTKELDVGGVGMLRGAWSSGPCFCRHKPTPHS